MPVGRSELFAVWFLCLRGLWIGNLIGERIRQEIVAIDQVAVPSGGFIGRGKVPNILFLAAQRCANQLNVWIV